MNDSASHPPSGEPVDPRAAFLDRHGIAALPLAAFDLALTHRSHAYEAGLAHDNERLEFLGDAVLGAICGEWLYERDPAADEGLLSKRRALLVSRPLLGRQALALGLDRLILLGRGERETGGAARRSTLGSALEAIIGAVFLELGFSAARRFVRRSLLEAMAASSAAADAHQGDYKSALQELTQARHHEVPAYRTLEEIGPDHHKEFTVEVSVLGVAIARASGRRKKQAANEAARLALERLRTEPPTG